MAISAPDGESAAAPPRALVETESEECLPEARPHTDTRLGADDDTRHLCESQIDQDKQHLIQSDAQMARVTEDLIEVLIEKNAIKLTDLPPAARTKIMRRLRLRDRLSSLIGLVSEDGIL